MGEEKTAEAAGELVSRARAAFAVAERRNVFQPSVPRDPNNRGEFGGSECTQNRYLHLKRLPGALQGGCGGICRLTDSSSLDNTQKAQARGVAQIADPGTPGFGLDPIETLRQSWRTDAPPAGLFCSRSPPNGNGNNPSLFASRPA